MKWRVQLQSLRCREVRKFTCTTGTHGLPTRLYHPLEEILRREGINHEAVRLASVTTMRSG